MPSQQSSGRESEQSDAYIRTGQLSRDVLAEAWYTSQKSDSGIQRVVLGDSWQAAAAVIRNTHLRDPTIQHVFITSLYMAVGDRTTI